MRFLIIISCFILSCGFRSSETRQTKKKLSNNDYLIINIFLEEFKPHIYLDLSIINEEDSTLIKNYNRKVKLYESFNKLCLENLSKNKKLNYETNFSCSTANAFKIYKNLFSKEELKEFSLNLDKKQFSNYTIDFKKIISKSVKPLSEEISVIDKTKILKIYGVFYNNDKNKVIVKYSINGKNLYYVIEKNNNWWKKLTNF